MSEADMCFDMSKIISLMLSVCSKVKLKMSVLFIPSENTSAHSVW